ncbi:MAG: energy-coupling factor ABC transporter ATP-binding protein [Planctomycetota bacterium]
MSAPHRDPRAPRPADVAKAADAAARAEPVVEVNGLNYTYPGGVEALRDIHFRIHAGSRVGVLGPNGAGKSTLLLHLSGILPAAPHASKPRPPGAGASVRIAGLPLEARTLPRIRQQVGMVFQNPDDQLFCPTVFDDIAFGPRNMGLPEAEVQRRVQESLAQVGLLDRPPVPPAPPDASAAPTHPAASLPAPKALLAPAQALLARNPMKLSVGQKKRVALATVLSMQPALIALDEPTSNLDPRGRADIARLLASLACTQIVVTHDLDLVRDLCDDVLLMSRGRIVLQGSAREVLADTAALRAAELL